MSYKLGVSGPDAFETLGRNMEKEPKTHIAWDRDMLIEIFPGQVPKTSKTLCGKRVKRKYIVKENPTCPGCRYEDREERRVAAEHGVEI